jgi:ATP adenylyltransferase
VARPRRPLWAPWRLEYVRSAKPEGCVFCRALAAGDDRENLVVHRGRAVFVMLNRYPYNAGHLMVLPHRHVAFPEDLTEAEASEFWATLVWCKKALDAFMSPQGYNVGLNLGKVAGAGMADHLHLHVVPRWAGDTNFMPVVGDVHVVSQHLLQVYDGLAARLSAAKESSCSRS